MIDFENLKFGDSIHDMHYGLHDLMKTFAEQSPDFFITGHVHTPAKNGRLVIELMIRNHAEQCPDKCSKELYVNKLLVLVGVSPDDKYLFAYSYDNTTLGFVEIEKNAL